MINIEYKVLGNGKAFLLNRNPHVGKERVRLKFAGAPEGSTAIISVKGESYYRELEGGCCTIPVSVMDGEVGITLSVMGGVCAPKAWQCESLIAKKMQGGTLIHPEDMNLPNIVAAIAVENDELRAEQSALKSEIARLNKRIDSILEGYDLT